MARPGTAWQGYAGKAGRGRAWRGTATQAWHGTARLGGAGLGNAGKARPGMAGRGYAGTDQLNFFWRFLMSNQPSYQFRQSARVKGGVDAQTVGETLASLEDKHGGITAPMVVDESRPEDAPLHPCFTWDDQEAAELYRETEARSIVRSVRVIYPDTKESEPAFVHVRPMEEEEPTGPGFYANTREVVRRFSLYESAWRDARDRLNSAAKALEDLERVARGHINDQAVARADAAKAAISHVATAAEVLEAAS